MGRTERLYRSAWSQLHRTASWLISHEQRPNSLRATALVNESFLRLQNCLRTILNEEHLCRISEISMRRFLIDRARTRKRLVSIESENVPELLAARHELPLETRLTIDRAMRDLQRHLPLVADTVRLKCMEGLTFEEIGHLQGRKISGVRRDLSFGLKKLARLVSH
jgi:DNA-directed RNA polymerase specialized sigma24 family protein